MADSEQENKLKLGY